MNLINIIFAVLLSYFLGAIPTSYIIAKVLKGIDIREHGSRNVGATNVMRVVGKGPGIIALLLDAAKGLLPVVLIAPVFYKTGIISEPSFRVLLGISAVCGHIWTIFLKFKGGKGVATTIGVFMGLSPFIMAAGLLCWLVVAFIFKYVSLSSLAMAAILPFLMILFSRPI